MRGKLRLSTGFCGIDDRLFCTRIPLTRNAAMFSAMSLALGAVVGLSLGLTGGGGSILAVPLLVYGLGATPRDAIGISLITVGAIAGAGAIARWMRGELDLPAGWLFSLAGMLGAPLGVFVGHRLNEDILLLGFALLMGIVAVRMWQKSRADSASTGAEHRSRISPSPAPSRAEDAPSLSVPSGGATSLPLSSPASSSSRRWLVFLGAGLLTGIFSGLFGIGGGFLIVPALVLIARMDMPRAAATSLLVIFLISLSGTMGYLWAGSLPSGRVLLPFILGGMGGMMLGVALSRYLSGPTLQRLFAVMILIVGGAVIVQTLPQLWRSSVTFLRLANPS
ncbi:sulfite exporter TauE/SafE family protein [Thermogemmata fonticola]|jgi:uncharacterized membrane protein YfcA|uniref:Probable membrane transporter protein n=1 Tax=Thermogemmata fonticola TaxID=2755323 RepID=A0A7V9AB33_9BACT|nr:sulfite exporter TauE/SafE family protein [Thermogemmata fonticola]MBA2225633.1 sulfite exporter TauE/SafE family protein [Thermogemmata fonticola]